MSAAVVQPDTGELTVLMSKDEALVATAKVKSYMGVLCQLVKELHDKQAWRALGYGSWAAYCKAEFDYSRSYSYRLIGHVNRLLELSAAAGIEAEVSPMGDTFTERATRDLDMAAATEAVAEAVADLPAEATDDDRAQVAAEAVRNLTTSKIPESDPPVAPDADPVEEPATSTGPQDVEPEATTAPVAPVPDPGPTEVPPSVDGQTDSGETPVEGADALPAVHPSLPGDWRDRLARSVQLLGCPVEALRVALTEDDRIDLTELRDHLTAVLKEKNA